MEQMVKQNYTNPGGTMRSEMALPGATPWDSQGGRPFLRSPDACDRGTRPSDIGGAQPRHAAESTSSAGELVQRHLMKGRPRSDSFEGGGNGGHTQCGRRMVAIIRARPSGVHGCSDS